jgi:hypothetical protein
MKATTITLALLTLIAPRVAAPTNASATPEPFVVAAGDMLLGELIDRSAAYLDCNILVAQGDLAGPDGPVQFRLQKPVSLDHDGCEDFLGAMLYRSGLALTWVDSKGATREVLAIHGPRGRDISMRAQHATVEAVLARPDSMNWVTTFVPLVHINATIATNALRPFFASSGSSHTNLTLSTTGSNAKIVLQGLQCQVAQTARLLRLIDTPMTEEEMLDAAAGGPANALRRDVLQEQAPRPTGK